VREATPRNDPPLFIDDSSLSLSLPHRDRLMEVDEAEASRAGAGYGFPRCYWPIIRRGIDGHGIIRAYTRMYEHRAAHSRAI